jgi:polar amino acid transport system substrate-binding protein
MKRTTDRRRARAAGLTLPALAAVALAISACGSDDDNDKSTATAAGTASAAACVPKDKFTTHKPGKLIVSVAPALPYVQLKDGKLSGIDGDVITAFAKRECLEVDAQQFPGSAGALPAMESGRADIVTGGWYRTPERVTSKTLGVTDPVYYDFTAFVSKQPVDTLEALRGKKIALGSGQLWTAQVQKVLGKGSIKLFDSTSGVFQDVASGRSAAGIMGSAEAGYYTKKAPGAGLVVTAAKPDPAFESSQAINAVNFLHAKSNAGLTQALDASIAAFRADGTVEASLKRWGLTNSVNFTGKQ